MDIKEKRLTLEEVAEYRAFFDECDFDKDGFIDRKEFDSVLKAVGVSKFDSKKAVNYYILLSIFLHNNYF